MKNILDRNYNRLVNRAIARSYMNGSSKGCPTCSKRREEKDVKRIMSDIKRQFHG